MPRGGRRPGAGAPSGNINGMKNGLYSQQLVALNLAIEMMPGYADIIRKITAGDVRSVRMLAYILRCFSDVLLLRVRGGSIEDLHDVRNHAMLAYIFSDWDYRTGKRRPATSKERAK